MCGFQLLTSGGSGWGLAEAAVQCDVKKVTSVTVMLCACWLSHHNEQSYLPQQLHISAAGALHDLAAQY